MLEWLNLVLSRIADGTLLPTSYYAQLDCNAALDARESDANYDTALAPLSVVVNERWVAADANTIVQGLVEDIRRESFLTVSEATHQHEIASYVSDDLDLIVRGRLAGVEDELLDQLWAVYQRGEFPSPYHFSEYQS